MTRKLRIAVVTHFFPSSSQPHRGRPMYEEMKALAKLAEVRVFCLDPAYPRWSVLRPRTFLYRDSSAAHTLPAVDVRYVRYPALPVVTRAVNGYSCGRALVPHLRDMAPDVILGFFLYPEGFGAVTAGNTLGVPVIAGALGSDLRLVRGRLGRKLVGRTLREAAFVLSVSEELRARALDFGVPPEGCRTIRNGCDFDIFHPADRLAARLDLNIDAAAELVVFTGRLVPLKGLRELLEAVAALAASRPRLQLACIGEGPMEPELHERASQPDLRGRVHFAGSTPPERIARFLAACNVFCLPSHSEGCPNVVIEALSCGRPVVASDVGGIPELVDPRCGLLVPPQNAEKLAAGIAAALEHLWDERRIAASFRRSWDDMARETFEICCSVAHKPELAVA